MKNVIERKEYSDKLLSYKDKDIIGVVTGLRRLGKSKLLELFRNRLLMNGVIPEQTQFCNFELPEIRLLTRYSQIRCSMNSPYLLHTLSRLLSTMPEILSTALWMLSVPLGILSTAL
ncbi:MAG: hypothetical protein LBM07_09040 [Culturomica sp.]|jgi:predicted AAA+ superfamily ATPase|nr:hypothetical protein [Culturomica sp.]